MDQYNHAPFDEAGESQGLAIGGFIASLVSLILLPPLGLIGAILSAVAWNRAATDPQRYGGKGFAIAGTVIGSAATLLTCLLAFVLTAVMLPALGSARESAREIRSQAQVRAINSAMMQYRMEYSVELPADADWQAALSRYLPDPEIFIAHGDDDPTTPSYFRIIWPDSETPVTDAPVVDARVVIVEDPSIRTSSTVVGFDDGHVRSVDDAELRRLLSGAILPAGLRLP